jgi:hypothetical protein
MRRIVRRVESAAVSRTFKMISLRPPSARSARGAVLERQKEPHDARGAHRYVGNFKPRFFLNRVPDYEILQANLSQRARCNPERHQREGERPHHR